MKSPDPKIIVAADAKKPTETVAARAFSLAESNFWLRNLKIRDYEALFARTIEDTNHPHLFNHDTPLGTAPKSRKRSITSQKATIWYVAYMLAYASVLHLTICQITWSLWLGTRGLTKLGLKLMS